MRSVAARVFKVTTGDKNYWATSKSGQRSGACMKNDVHGEYMHSHSRVSPFEEVIIHQSKVILNNVINNSWDYRLALRC